MGLHQGINSWKSCLVSLCFSNCRQARHILPIFIIFLMRIIAISFVTGWIWIFIFIVVAILEVPSRVNQLVALWLHCDNANNLFHALWLVARISLLHAVLVSSKAQCDNMHYFSNAYTCRYSLVTGCILIVLNYYFNNYFILQDWFTLLSTSNVFVIL